MADPTAPVATEAPVAAPETAESAEPQLAPPAQDEEATLKPKLAKDFAALTRLKREIKAREAKVKAAEEELSLHRSFTKRLSDPNEKYKAAKDLGIEYDGYTKFILDSGQPQTDPKLLELQNEVKQLRAEQAQKDTAAVAAQNEATIRQFRTDMEKNIISKSDKYKLINKLGDFDGVYDRVLDYIREYGEPPDLDKACEIHEQWLTSKWGAVKDVFSPPPAADSKDFAKSTRTQSLSVARSVAPSARPTVKSRQEKLADDAAFLAEFQKTRRG